jgi:N-acetylmuramoyl-L-alanine amidase
VKRIVLDPGHGDTDSGAVSLDGIRESDVVLSIAYKVRDILKHSFDVCMTRDSDTFVSLNYRSAYANSLGDVAAFISIHCNSATNTSARGWEIFTSKGNTGDADKLAASIGKRYAARFQDLPARGLKEANFSVLQHTNMPAVLVECCFLSNPEEAHWISSDEIQQQHAEAIADGIIDHLGGDSELTLEQRVTRIETFLEL